MGDRLIRLHALHADPGDSLRRDRRGGLSNDPRQVDAVDDLLRQADEIEPGHDGVEIDPGHDAVEVQTGHDGVEIDPGHDGVGVHPGHDAVEVQTGNDAVEVQT